MYVCGLVFPLCVQSTTHELPFVPYVTSDSIRSNHHPYMLHQQQHLFPANGMHHIYLYVHISMYIHTCKHTCYINNYTMLPPLVYNILRIYQYVHVYIYAAQEASWRRVFDPSAPLLFNLYHYLEQNLPFGLVFELAGVDTSGWVRHLPYSKQLFVR